MSERVPESIGDEATRWFVLLGDSGVSERERRACAAWLAADPLHAEAWREVEALWSGLQPPLPDVAAPTASRRSVLLRGLTGLVAAGGLLAGGGALTLWSTPGASAAVRTALGERRSLVLADGTAVELNGGSAMTPLPDGTGVALFRGQAYFTLAPGRRGFAVVAGEGRATCDGGAFDVKLREDEVIVTVAEGTLALRRDGGTPTALAAGQAARCGPLGVSAPEPVSLSQVLAWRQGRLVFEDAPVAAVLTELQRYLAARLVLADQAAGQLRLTAVFDLDRIDAALDTLATILPLRVRRVGGLLVLVEAAV